MGVKDWHCLDFGSIECQDFASLMAASREMKLRPDPVSR